jgi:hypothetical protein
MKAAKQPTNAKSTLSINSGTNEIVAKEYFNESPQLPMPDA